MTLLLGTDSARRSALGQTLVRHEWIGIGLVVAGRDRELERAAHRLDPALEGIR